MLNKQEFNLWANDYDKTVQVSEENSQYPFAGYKTILNTIFNEIMSAPGAAVLDIGFGTGTLTSRLYENGHRIDGVDFSSEMTAIASSKMPKANLVEWDFSEGLPPDIREKTYDAVISTYALHHLNDEAKIAFIEELLPLLNEGGRILIGDIAFGTRDELDRCRIENSRIWDEDEFYFVFKELKEGLKDTCRCRFIPVSHCGGVIEISPSR
ncbi:SAM-dependent methyltransferase [Alteribacter lacisalsi]|uniref:SAM-dependent methyltransferase n=1 Tax=Alteribacter lacisalsi TaxID=2045244 RepID=A0A2W0H9E8_9BACI|nr:class I SAM-dependent methyltransferase [Alteribacter lacisalsi]PYZ96700.1 SAM-dependent methyltransferase [Alteribacter lacisalsi]